MRDVDEFIIVRPLNTKPICLGQSLDLFSKKSLLISI